MTYIINVVSQIQQLETGRGLQYLINAAYEIIGNPLVIFDMNYKLIAYTESIVTDDRFWNEIVETGVFCSESIQFFVNEYFVDAVANTDSIAVLTSDKLLYDRLYGRIFNSDNFTIADLVMVACEKPIDSEMSCVFKAICEKLSYEICANDYYQRYGVLYHDALINTMLEEKIADKLIYSGHLANLYEGLKANLYVGVAGFDIPTDKYVIEELRDSLKKLMPQFKYAVYLNYIVMIISSDELMENIEQELSGFNEVLEQNSLFIGISNRFENLFDLQRYYIEAVNLLSNGIKSGSQQRIFTVYQNCTL